MEQTPRANRVHIGFFGRRNAGKSSLINAIAGQTVSVVSPVCGTTTDTVEKAMELLPIGAVVYLLFCVSKWGWGFDKYVAEANKGEGLKFAKWLKPYFQFILPALIVVIFLQGLL